MARRRTLLAVFAEIPALSGVAITAVCTGCASPGAQERFPPVAQTIAIVDTRPVQDEAGVDPEARIDLCFSGYLDPRSVGELDAVLDSGLARFDTQVDVQLFAWRAPKTKTTETDDYDQDPGDAPWCSGSVVSMIPSVPMEPGLRYRVRVRPSAVGWAGESLDTTHEGWEESAAPDEAPTYTLSFRTSLDEPDPEPDPGPDPAPAPSLTDLFAPGSVLDPDPAGAARCGCHAEDDSLARARLDLSSPARAFEDLVVRQELAATGFPMVAPFKPSESYLIQTLLRDDDGAPLRHVLGDTMPPEEPLPHADMVALARWIEGGANL